MSVMELARIQNPENGFLWRRVSVSLMPVVLIDNSNDGWIMQNIKIGIKRFLQKIGQKRQIYDSMREMKSDANLLLKTPLVVKVENKIMKFEGISILTWGGPNIGFSFSAGMFFEGIRKIESKHEDDPTVFQRLVRRIAAHEFGHVVGLRHCSRKCLMRNRTETLTEMITQMYKMEKSERYICPLCIKETEQNYQLLKM